MSQTSLHTPILFFAIFFSQVALGFETSTVSFENEGSTFAPNYLGDASKIFVSEEVDIEWSKKLSENYRQLFNKKVERTIKAELTKVECRSSVCKLEFKNLDTNAKKLELEKINRVIYSQPVTEKFYTQSEAYGKEPNKRIIYIADAARHKKAL